MFRENPIDVSVCVNVSRVVLGLVDSFLEKDPKSGVNLFDSVVVVEGSPSFLCSTSLFVSVEVFESDRAFSSLVIRVFGTCVGTFDSSPVFWVPVC